MSEKVNRLRQFLSSLLRLFITYASLSSDSTTGTESSRQVIRPCVWYDAISCLKWQQRSLLCILAGVLSPTDKKVKQ